jgi:MOSC domain-containing protein YiiM
MKLISVNIGKEQTIVTTLISEQTGIHKLPVQGEVMVTPLGLEGDFIASTRHHGGPDQAVYLYGMPDYAWWENELGYNLPPGTFGENLTIEGLESANCFIGDRLSIADVVLEVTAPRIPCGTFAARMGDPRFVRRFRRAQRPGVYCRVLQAGSLRAGETVAFQAHSGEAVTLLEVFNNYYDKHAGLATLEHLLRAPVAIRVREQLLARQARLLQNTAPTPDIDI